MDSENSNSKTMDYHGSSLHLQVPKFENHFILPNFSRTNFLSRMLQALLLNPNWVDYYEPTYHFYQLFLYLFIMVNLCAMDYNSWLHSYDTIISYNHKSLTVLYKENQNKH